MVRRVAYSLLLSLYWLGSLTVWAENAGSAEQRILQLLNRPVNKKVHFSIHFYAPNAGKTVFAHHPDKPLIPASNMKLITSAAALDQLGPDFVYQTVFALWEGNLAIIAAGDPLTGDPVLAQRNGKNIYSIFEQVLQQLRQRKKTIITGDLLIDDTIFDDVRFHPSWPSDQANNWYVAQVSALNFNDNCVDINLTPAAQPQQPVSYTLTPQTGYVSITNKCTSITEGSNTSWGARLPDTNNITLRGTCRTAQTIYVTVDRPSAYFGFALAEYLLRNGVRINGKLVIKNLCCSNGQPPEKMDRLLNHCTALKDLLNECNRRSLNLVAECLFKTLGAYYNPPPGRPYRQGSWQMGRKAVMAFLNKVKIDPDQYNIDDGGGLSHRNRLSARCITDVLSYMFRHKSADLYRNSLSTPTRGTLAKRRRFNQPALCGRVFAKTGSVTGARALSGYCKTNSGNWLAFSIITNNPPATPQTIDQIVMEMINNL